MEFPDLSQFPGPVGTMEGFRDIFGSVRGSEKFFDQ